MVNVLADPHTAPNEIKFDGFRKAFKLSNQKYKQKKIYCNLLIL